MQLTASTKTSDLYSINNGAYTRGTKSRPIETRRSYPAALVPETHKKETLSNRYLQLIDPPCTSDSVGLEWNLLCFLDMGRGLSPHTFTRCCYVGGAPGLQTGIGRRENAIIPTYLQVNGWRGLATRPHCPTANRLGGLLCPPPRNPRNNLLLTTCHAGGSPSVTGIQIWAGLSRALSDGTRR